MATSAVTVTRNESNSKKLDGKLKTKSNGNSLRKANAHEFVPLWTGPSKVTTIRVAKAKPFESLLKPSFKEPTGFKKKPQDKPVHLSTMGFANDEHVYVPHQIPARAVLQYNPDHYPEWKRYLKELKIEDNSKRNALLDVGGFGENIVVENTPHTPAMDETTMCIGDLVSFQREDETELARVRVNGSRMPCYKLDHRFGIPNMSKRSQDTGWTGWLYGVEKEGDVEVGCLMVLLDRPNPKWPVSRVQYYLYKEPKNFDMIKEVLDTLGNQLAPDAKDLFQDRLNKGMEDMSLRLQGHQPQDVLTDWRLSEKIRQTGRVSEFVFERVKKVPTESKEFAWAKSGSHIRLSLKVEGKTIVRSYSVISGDSNKFNLGIALAENSRGGSDFMHNKLKVKDTLEASEDFANTFSLQEENVREHVFLAGGIGITAFLDHIRHCVDTKQKFHLHYMIRNKSDYAFQALIEEMIDGIDTAKVTVYISADNQRCDLKQILTGLAKENETHIYVCGSERMSTEVKTHVQTLAISESRVHHEQFSVDVSGDPFTVETTQSKKNIKIGVRQTLLDALRDAGLEVASSCETGNCGTCRVKVKCGRVLHKGTGLMYDEKAGFGGREEGEMLSCVSRGVGTISIEV